MTLKSAPDKSLYFISDDDDEPEPTFEDGQNLLSRNTSNPIMNTFLGIELGEGII